MFKGEGIKLREKKDESRKRTKFLKNKNKSNAIILKLLKI